MRAEYAIPGKELPLGTVLRALFGGALLVGGLLLVLAHSWADLGRSVRVGLSFLPLLATLGLGFWILAKDLRSIALREGVALANSLSVALALSLISEVYNISGNFADFALWWALCSLPVALLLEGAAAWVLFQILAMLWAWNLRTQGWSLPGYLGLELASLVLCLPSVWTEKKRQLGTLLAVVFFLTFTGALGATVFPVEGTAWRFAAYSLWFGIAWLAGGLGFSRAGGYLRVLASLGLVIILVFLSFGDTWTHFYFHGRSPQVDNASHTGCIVWLALLGMALFGIAGARLRKLDLLAWLALGAALLPLVGAWLRLQGASPLQLMIGANLYGALFALEALRSGLKEMDAIRINFGGLLFSALVVSRFFDSELSYLLRGLVFIALGLGFLGMNVWLKKRRSSLEKEGSR